MNTGNGFPQFGSLNGENTMHTHSVRTFVRSAYNHAISGRFFRRAVVRQRAALYTLLSGACLMCVLPGGTASAQATNSPENVLFGSALQYDNGATPHVGLNNAGHVVEVHKSQAASSLWYHVGALYQATVNWGQSYNYDSGVTPSVAVNSSDQVVEAHQSQSNFGLWYHVGAIRGDSIAWGGSVHYDNGVTPSIAVSGQIVVETHRSQGNFGLWYHLGRLTTNGIAWNGSVQYDSGVNPSVAVNGPIVVEVHKSQYDSSLWYHVGSIAGDHINWGPSTNYDTGSNPSVAITSDGLVVESHHSTAGILYSRVGSLQNGGIVWNTPSTAYDRGEQVGIACNDQVAIQVHSNVLGTTLWFSTSLITNRADWMHDGLATIGNKTISDITFPGSHDTGMYVNGLPGLAQTQDMSVYQALHAGVRYFDVRPTDSQGGLTTYHGDSPFRYYGASVSTILNDVRAFLREGHDELIVLKFSHTDFSDSSSYTDLTTLISQTLGSWLYTGLPSGKRLSDLSLNTLIGAQGRVLAVYDGADAVNTPVAGIYAYRDWDASDPSWGDLRVYDSYANSANFNTMMQDQLNKFSSYTGMCTDNRSKCDLFLLSWTLTPQTSDASPVWTLALNANSTLGDVMARTSLYNTSGKRINVLYTDYVEYSRSTDVSLYMNDLVP